MYCSECGKQNNDNAKFCIACGSPTHFQSEIKDDMMLEINEEPSTEKILDYIDGIKRSGLSTSEVGYGNWIIVFTNNSIYIVKKGSYYVCFLNAPVGMAGGALGGYVLSKALESVGKSEAVGDSELTKLLADAKIYFEFNPSEFSKISLQKNAVLSSINWIIFQGKNNNKIKIILTKEQYSKFIENCINIYSYDFSKNERPGSFLGSILELSEK